LGDWNPGLLVGPDLVLFVGASAMAALLGARPWGVVAAAWTTLVTIALGGYALVAREAGWGAVLMVVATIGTLAASLTLWFDRLPTRWFFRGPFSFRVAGERSGGRHLRHSLTQLVAFWTLLLILLPYLLSRVEQRLRLKWSPLGDPAWTWVGAVVFVVASALGLWSCVSMALRGEGTPLPAATARKLVVVGPYRFVRNPMAVAGAIQTVGVGLWFGSWMVIVASIAGAIVWNTIIRPEEEADLAARFGADYEAYRAAVRCWIPSTPRPRSAIPRASRRA
jgi:protein-S-isoprenylcysteine O-methyltransferase Ste14